MTLRLSFAERGTPEWHLGRAIAGVARAGGLDLELVRMPGGEARQIAAIHEGMAELSVNIAEAVRWAYRAEGAYDGWRHTSLRAIGTIWKPQWLAVAVRWELGIRSLDELAEWTAPLRALVHVPDGPSTSWSYLTRQLLRAHGVSLEDITARGGRVTDCVTGLHAAREGDFDLLVAPLGTHRGAWGRIWHDASVSANLRFLGLSDAVAERFERRQGVGARPLPAGILRGVEEGISALWFSRYLVYASERLERDEALTLFAALADGRRELLDEHAWFDRGEALTDSVIPPHAALREPAEAAALGAGG
jgi:TRAP-type uncharacterized transport system substrate-binding protein